jgi:ABC-type transporter Mla subunit MlaD
LSGGIGDLLSVGGDSGADGVEALLGGVALSMISSIMGIILTTWGSNKFKTAKSQVESDKHGFLSWIQAKLLPTRSDNVVDAIREMTENLNNFNEEFAENTGNLRSALEKVNESYKMQVQLLDSVRKIADKDLAQQNLQLYNALKNSAAEIGTLAEYLKNCNDYLANVKSLNEKLDLQENRTRAIEEIGAFFKTELKQIEARKGVIAQSVGKVDDYLQQALEKLKEHTDASFLELQKSSVKQQDILRQKNEEINTSVTELKNLTEVKKAISGFESAIKGQNAKIDNLVNAIQALANAISAGANTLVSLKPQMPAWKKALIWCGSVLGGLVLLSLCIANWDSILNFLNEVFRI